MARYEITAPDGTRYEITAPEGASEQDVMSYAQQQFAQAPRQRPDPIERPSPIERPGSTPQRAPQRQAPSRLEQDVLRAAPRIEATPAPREPALRDASLDPSGGIQGSVGTRRFGFVPPGVNMAQSQPVPPPDTGMDVLKSFGAGVARGGIGLASLPATLEQLYSKSTESIQGQIPEPVRRAAGMLADYGGPIAAPARMISGGPTNKPTQEGITEAVEGVTGPIYQPQTLSGEYARTVGEFVPGGIGPGSLMRKAANVVLPGVMSEAGGQAAKGSQYEPVARAVGAVGGAMLPNAAMRLRSPFPITDPERARMVQNLQREGVELTAGDTTGRRPLQWAESTARDIPFTGRKMEAGREARAESYTRAVLKRAEIDAPRATDAVIDDAYRKLGDEFDGIAKTASVPLTKGIAARAQEISRRYERITEPSLRNPLPKSIADDIVDYFQRAGPGQTSTLPSELYAAWRSDIGAAARAAKDPRTERALYDIQRLLDDAAEKALRDKGGWQANAAADRMREARRAYRNLLVISKARGSGEDAAAGLISPQQLQTAAKQMEGWQGFSRGKGDFTDLAKSGVAVISKLPNSGTAQRLAAHGLMTTLGAISGGQAGGTEGAAAGGVMSLLAQAAMARGLMSRPVQRRLANQTMAKAINQSNARTPLIIGGIPLTQDRDKRR